jgi:hypothetical protein
MSDFARLMIEEAEVRRWRAEHENTSARLEIANARRNCSFLISQHDPVAKLGIDREKLRAVLAFVWHGDVGRMERDFAALDFAKVEVKP